jgi:two-component system, cell cycle sensor histidine kinase and response regulator CckA
MKHILHALTDPAVLLDEGGRIILANDAWLALRETGTLPASAEVGSRYPELWAGVPEESVAAAVERVLSGEDDRWEAEHTAHTAGGERWYRAIATRLLDDPERRVFVHHREVTGRVLLEREVRHREAALDALGARGGDIVARFGADLRYIYVNAAASHATGRPREDFIGRTNGEMGVPEPLLSQWDGALRRVLATGKAVREEFMLPGPQGERIYESLAQPEVNDQGERVGVICVTRDVTEAREAEAAVRFHAEVLDQIGEVVMAADMDGRITYWNPAAERIYQWPAAEALGRPLREVMGAEGAAGAIGTIVETLLQGEPWAGELLVRRRDGVPIPLHVTGSPLLDGQGRIAGLVGIATDLTAHRRMEEDLRQAQKMEAIGQLAGGIAHDFNNILTAIQGNAEMALLDASEDDAVRGELEEIALSARRAAGLTQQLLAFARRQTSLPRPVDLNREVRSVEGMLERVLEQRVVLRTVLDSRPATVLMDPTQLDQILVNLAVNARDAMPNGGVLTITTAAVEVPDAFPGFDTVVPGGAYIRLQVRDEGTGMEEAVRARAFEPFYTTKETGKGTGLGLSTVYGIVSQAGGHIDLKSAPGEGTVVTILLPRADGAAAAAEEEAACDVSPRAGAEADRAVRGAA